MQYSAWITLAAVVVALAIGVTSIWHTRNMQKREHRHRLLDEIIKWATDILKGGDLEASYKLASENIREDVRATLSGLSSADTFEGFRIRSPYILLISRSFRGNLGNAVEKAIQELNKTTELLYKLIGTEGLEQNEMIEEFGKQRYELLNPSINAVIEQATNLKIENIG